MQPAQNPKISFYYLCLSKIKPVGVLFGELFIEEGCHRLVYMALQFDILEMVFQ